MATQVNDSYQTDGSNNQISISVKTGFAQSYTNSITLDGAPLSITPPADDQGNYLDDFIINLGTNSALKGLLLEITSLAVINIIPPNSSMIVNLSGGTAPKQFIMNDPGAGKAVGDTIKYYASIALT